MTDFEANGENIYLEYPNVQELKEHPKVDIGPIPLQEQDFPLIATGFFDWRGIWRFYKTHGTRGEDYVLDGDEFIEGLDGLNEKSD